MRKIRVLHLIPTTTGGGAQRLVLDLNSELLNSGVASRILQLESSNKFDSTNVSSLDFKHPYEATLFPYRFIHWLNVNPSFDILHAHLTPAQLLAPLSRLSKNQPALVTTEHSTHNKRRESPFGKLADALIYKPYSSIICISEGTKNSLSEWQPAYSKKLATIKNGVNFDNFQYQEKSKKGNITKIVSIGRLAKVKNYEVALTAISKLDKYDFEYTIAGEGPEKDRLISLCRDLNISRKVNFIGHTTNVEKILQESDIFLITSLWEGFGLAAVEAMLCGLPVVASNVPGIREVVGMNKKCGLLVDPRNPSTISHALEFLITNPKKAQELSRNGRHSAQKYSIQETSKNHINLYSTLIKNQEAH